MNKSAADIDRGAQETFDSKSVEANRRADTVDDRIHCSHLMKLNVLGRNVMHLPFGYRELRKNIRGHSFCIRVDRFPNHRKNLGSLAMKVRLHSMMLMNMIVVVMPW